MTGEIVLRGRKNLGMQIIYKDRAKTLGILDKIEKDSRFELRRITFNTGKQIEYYKFIVNETGERMVPIIKQFIKESKENVLFTYDPKDFENAINDMKSFIQDESNGYIHPYEVGEGCRYSESVPTLYEDNNDLSASAKLQQDLLNEIEERIDE